MSRAAKKPDPPLKFEFTTNSVRNTTVSVDDDKFIYEIVTRYWHPNITKINKVDVESREVRLIAEIEKAASPGAEERVRLGGEGAQWVDASEFLKQEANGATTWVSETGEEYRWDKQKGKLALLKASEEAEKPEPLAKYHPHKRHFFFFRMSKHAWLEVKPEAVGALDQLIISYILVERKRRHGKA
ncbi:hypothetical protein PUNSTDRAFT_146604 [Punctularia strigosozonata HHB-11173 SS5]|uniref:DUF6593 domain-containing protein n=1 Tax=Punctularia strigosozonata (strain HHB-11173) TaxID=741275 RepID=R7S2Q9_PUNST|nr:uncharacterized protein PUNSTDRAFT_146604 [Punctularia strigosozonata HHB-11173 SS5]EIN04077.1 hypothetical protein PUNSTDRAFT_146604 [Punctularia strigosozonata HHB-11173 SS5]